jgi:gluconolactonase
MITLGEATVRTELIDAVWQGIDHAEGLAIAEDGTVWCGGEDGQIYRGRLDGQPEQVATVPGRTLGFALDGDGNAYCAAIAGAGLFRIDADGRVDSVSHGTPELPLRLPNHPAFLPTGVLLLTDSGSWGADDGCTFAVAPDGRTSVADLSAARFPNGLCVSPDGCTVFVVESTLPGVSALSVSPDGSLGERRVVIEMPATVPDGVALDERGRLLISCWAPDAVFLLDAGQLRLLAHDPLRYALHEPTNIAFVPGTSTVVAANYGERFLSMFEHDAVGGSIPRPSFRWRR